jgi:cytochrome bd-type quinol oxidase subunit 1
MQPSPSKIQPALLGGAFMGVLSALPFVSYANVCCCLWVVVGGLLSAWVLQQNDRYQITTSDGAIVGLLAGVFGALIGIVITMVMAPFQRQLDLYVLGRLTEAMGDVPPVIEQAIEQRRSQPAVTALSAITSLIFSLIIYPVFAMLGGLLGAVLFKKGELPPPPPSAVDQLYPPLSDHPPVP